jgi:hypothetical protein
LVHNLWLSEDVIYAQADLTSVDELRMGYSPSRKINISRPGNDARALPAQFKYGWCEMLRGGGGDETSGCTGTCEKDLVEAFLEDVGHLGWAGSDDPNSEWIKILRNKMLKKKPRLHCQL